jgi:hypothetical protein
VGKEWGECMQYMKWWTEIDALAGLEESITVLA